MKRAYILTEEQLAIIDSAMTLAQYYISDHEGDSDHDQWSSDYDTYNEAMKVLAHIKGETK